MQMVSIFFLFDREYFSKLKNRTVFNCFYDIIRLILIINYVYIIFGYFIINTNYISFNFNSRLYVD